MKPNEPKKNNSRYLMVGLKGMAIGAADVVPGVSGGTIAFISGIYEELIESIKNVDLTALKLLLTGKFKQFWTKINGKFLGSVILGIAISIFTLAKTMKWLLENQPIGTWSFFFGLVIASAILVSREVTKWNAGPVISLITGIAIGYVITALSPTTTPETWWFIIISGAIAICAMILPGISGAFILLLMGKYHYIMTAVSELNFPVLLLFALGAVVGITSFSHVLSWLLRNHHNVVVALLIGFMVGSLNKVWPWKQAVETYVDSHGNIQPLVETNVMPSTYEALVGDPHLAQGIIWCLAGISLILVIELISRMISKKRA